MIYQKSTVVSKHLLYLQQIGWCNKIPANYCDEHTGNLHDECYSLYAQRFKLPRFCERIPPYDFGQCEARKNIMSYRNYCFYELGIALDEKSLCGKITVNDSTQLCHELVRSYPPRDIWRDFPKPPVWPTTNNN